MIIACKLHCQLPPAAARADHLALKSVYNLVAANTTSFIERCARGVAPPTWMRDGEASPIAPFTVHTRHTPTPDNAYPVAHTCFFSLELPAYSNLSTVRVRDPLRVRPPLRGTPSRCGPTPIVTARTRRGIASHATRRPLAAARIPLRARTSPARQSPRLGC